MTYPLTPSSLSFYNLDQCSAGIGSFVGVGGGYAAVGSYALSSFIIEEKGERLDC